MEGIIYGWYQPQINKWYIGQTSNPQRRKLSFLHDKLYSSSNENNVSKIDNARMKYTPSTWEYHVLFTYTDDNVEKLSEILNKKEKEFIKEYDSYNNGYNTSTGGEGVRGYKYGDDYKNKCRERAIGENNPFYGKHHDENTKKFLSLLKKGIRDETLLKRKEIKKTTYSRGIARTKETKLKCCINQPNRKEVIGIDANGNEYHFNSAAEAAKRINSSNQHIIHCCEGNYFDKIRNKYVNVTQVKGWKFHYIDKMPKYVEHDDSGMKKIIETCHKNGIKTSKPIDVYDMNNNFIETMPNQKQCAIKYNCNMTAIARCCKGGFMREGKWVHVYQVKGYKFKLHKNDDKKIED